MQNPFIALGVGADASREQVRAAYHAKVKLCHPDLARDAASQQVAQDELTQLNLVYQEAMRRVAERETTRITIPDPKQVAQKLYEQGQLDSALRILNKTHDRDAGWHALQGSILLKKGEPEAAHASFRAAIHLSPADARLREMALSAAVMMRKQKTFRGRVECWARGVMGR